MKDEYKEMVCWVRFIDGVPANVYLSGIEIVRCKDCKYSVDKYDEGDCYCYYDKSLNYIGDNWNHYCGWAERKEE